MWKENRINCYILFDDSFILCTYIWIEFSVHMKIVQTAKPEELRLMKKVCILEYICKNNIRIMEKGYYWKVICKI